TPVGDPLPDAQEPGEPITITFGERTGADVANVTRDSTIREDRPLDNYGTSTVFAPDADPNQRGLLRIDTSAIPSSAEVLAVELEVYVSNPIEEGQVQVHQLLEDWNEDQTNWRDRRSNQRWTAAGAGIGSHAAAVMGTLPVDIEGAYTMQLSVEVVQQWVSSPSANHGMLWISTSTTGRGAELKSRDSSIATARPLLRVTYR
ncbi:MAG TPA: DNRLRE domain-containing protein, partial [Kofleriaceae bacterium]|nr:DNRLRE domain-containing protein [Kofleriaceae bacterium]